MDPDLSLRQHDPKEHDLMMLELLNFLPQHNTLYPGTMECTRMEQALQQASYNLWSVTIPRSSYRNLETFKELWNLLRTIKQ
jgi:hypothetical protein